MTPNEAAIARVKSVYASWTRETTAAQMREDWDGLFFSNALPAAEQIIAAGGVPATWFHPPGCRADRVLLYFHGGGFKLGSPRSHRDLIIRIAITANCRALAPAYRRAPEHHFPAPVEDAVATYLWLLGQGIPAAHITLAGDSAGAGLALSAMLSLRAQNQPLPAAAVLLSAWTDLTASGASYQTRATSDPIHQRGMILATAKTYLAGANPSDPLASPLFGDLHGLPPLLMQAGRRETVLDDTLDFAAKAKAAGADVKVSIFEDMIHVFQQFAPDLPEANQAIAEIAAFLNEVWA